MHIKGKEISEPNKPRLKPIEKPSSLKMKMADWLVKWKTGKVITLIKVSFSRFPKASGLAGELVTVQNKLTIHSRLMHLIKIYVATINGGTFCVDIGKASAREKLSIL